MNKNKVYTEQELNEFEQYRKELKEYVNNKTRKDLKKTDQQLIAEDLWRTNQELQERRKEALRNNSHKISHGLKRAYKNGRLEQQKKAMQTRDNTSHKAAGQKRAQDPHWQERRKEGQAALYSDPERLAKYQENYAKGNQAKYDKPEFWTNYYQAIAKRDSDPEYHKRRIAASNAKICKRVHTPAGIFDSITLAAQHYNLNPEGMRHRIKSKNYPDFYIIEK